MLARWSFVLETYDFSIEHRPGKYLCNADSLSRRPAAFSKRADCPDCNFKKLGQGEKLLQKILNNLLQIRFFP